MEGWHHWPAFEKSRQGSSSVRRKAVKKENGKVTLTVGRQILFCHLVLSIVSLPICEFTKLWVYQIASLPNCEFTKCWGLLMSQGFSWATLVHLVLGFFSKLKRRPWNLVLEGKCSFLRSEGGWVVDRPIHLICISDIIHITQNT